MLRWEFGGERTYPPAILGIVKPNSVNTNRKNFPFGKVRRARRKRARLGSGKRGSLHNLTQLSNRINRV